MTTQNRFFDDISKLMTNAMGVAQGARSEAETAMKGWIDRCLARLDLVTREEFEVQAAVLRRSREKLAALEQRVAALEAAADPPPTH